MAVYVDNARNPFGRMKMCHMLADTIGELLQMADKIGLDRRHFQPTSHPHFDVSLGYRARAIEAGAVEVDRRGIVLVMKTQRLRLQTDGDEQTSLSIATAGSTKGRIAAIRKLKQTRTATPE